MTPETIQFLNDNRIHHETLTKAFYMRSLSANVRERMQNIIRENWESTYHTDLWCGPCVSDMVLKLYRHYDEWLAQQPVTVQASFPSNKSE